MSTNGATSSGQSELLVVRDEPSLRQVLDRLLAADRYALDTEFIRERTYWPQVELVQVAWPESDRAPAGVALIDAQAVDLAAFGEVLSGRGTMVAHAAESDLEALEHVCGRLPSALFDTQVAAGFVGRGSASLATLTQQFLGVTLAKAERLTDWSRRPLSSAQLAYAAADVDRLLELADVIEAELVALGRLEWVAEECAELLRRASVPVPPERAWWKLRDSRQLRGQARGVAQELAAWRERRAKAVDLPVRHVLGDLAVTVIAQRQPQRIEELSGLRGVEGRHLRGVSREILDAVERGRRLDADQVVVPPSEPNERDLRAPVALASAWAAQVARDQRIDTALLATRADLVAYLGGGGGRVGRGWRADMIGRPLRQLAEGKAALAFDGKGGLVLEARSHRPVRESKG